MVQPVPKFSFKDSSRAISEAMNQRNQGQKVKVAHDELTNEWGVYILGPKGA